MQNSATEDRRNVVPRWRPLVALAPWAAASSRALTDRRITSNHFTSDLQQWRQTKSVENAFEIYSAGLMSGNKSLTLEGGLGVLARQGEVAPAVIDSIAREIAPKLGFLETRERLSQLETSDAYVRHTIHGLRVRLRDHPRDIAANLEIARLFAIVGDYEKSERFLRIAHGISPDNRHVLRAIVQLFDVRNDMASALRYLWKSDTVKYDPLVQSAEIAAADIAGKGSRVANRVKRLFSSGDPVKRSQSELVLALATLDNNSGVSERRVFKTVAAGLDNATENAVAQAVWLGDQSARKLKNRFPNLVVGDDAFEARAMLTFESRDYEQALQYAKLWFNDQPFQAHPLSFLCTCAAVYCGRATEVLPYANLALLKHSEDFNALNAANLVFINAGDRQRSTEALSSMSMLAKEPVTRAFLAAGEGMHSFAFGDPSEGQRLYFKAMEYARKASRRDLVFTAAMFYILGEANSLHASKDELDRAIVTIEGLLPKVPYESRDDAEKLLRRIKELIAGIAALNEPSRIDEIGLAPIPVAELPTFMEI